MRYHARSPYSLPSEDLFHPFRPIFSGQLLSLAHASLLRHCGISVKLISRLNLRIFFDRAFRCYHPHSFMIVPSTPVCQGALTFTESNCSNIMYRITKVTEQFFYVSSFFSLIFAQTLRREEGGREKTGNMRSTIVIILVPI